MFSLRALQNNYTLSAAAAQATHISYLATAALDTHGGKCALVLSHGLQNMSRIPAGQRPSFRCSLSRTHAMPKIGHTTIISCSSNDSDSKLSQL